MIFQYSRSNANILFASAKVFIRGKRTKTKDALSPQLQRAVTQLSVISLRKKQPKRLKLCKEDFIKHQTIQSCWSEYNKELRASREAQLKKQYESIREAMNVLSELNPTLFEAANASEFGKLFPLELRVPTQYPPNMIWYYDYKSSR